MPLVMDPAIEVNRDLLVLVCNPVELHLLQLLTFLMNEFLKLLGQCRSITDIIRQNSAPELFYSLLEYLEVFINLGLHVVDHNLVINYALLLEDGIHHD